MQIQFESNWTLKILFQSFAELFVEALHKSSQVQISEVQI